MMRKNLFYKLRHFRRKNKKQTNIKIRVGAGKCDGQRTAPPLSNAGSQPRMLFSVSRRGLPCFIARILRLPSAPNSIFFPPHLSHSGSRSDAGYWPDT